jgi:hypothetical protein
MGTLAETAIVDYRLSFADKGEQTSVFKRFCLQQINGSFSFLFAANKRKFPVSVFRFQHPNRSCRFRI